jgi:hypothetical protein
MFRLGDLPCAACPLNLPIVSMYDHFFRLSHSSGGCSAGTTWEAVGERGGNVVRDEKFLGALAGNVKGRGFRLLLHKLPLL